MVQDDGQWQTVWKDESRIEEFQSQKNSPQMASILITQGRREGTSSVAFEVLIMNCKKDFINLFIFNYLPSNKNLFILNCLMSNFCFPKNMYFASRREQLFVDARPYFRILNSLRKMMTCYLRETIKFLRYRTLCTSIL